nr:3-oxoacyl-[acyl-carrier-protein] synthase [Candidatus Cloacimonadota bacterium]
MLDIHGVQRLLGYEDSMIKIDGIQIKGIACCVPPDIEDNLNVPLFDADKRLKIVNTTGVRRRRITNKDTCTSDLALHAAKKLISNLEIDVNEIGILIFATQTPDYFLPATSHVLHKELGLSTDTITFDMNLGCSAYVYGLYVTSSLLQTAQKKYALLLAGDTISKYAAPDDASTRFLFGDAGSATILESVSNESSIMFSLGSDGNGWSNLIIPAGASRTKHSLETQKIVVGTDGNSRSEEHLFMDGMEIFNFTISTVVPHIQKVLDTCGMPDLVVFHQANKYMLEFMRKSLGIPKDIFLYSLSEYGNTSSASIPLSLCFNKAGIENNAKTLLSGFGVGYSWGTMVLSLKGTLLLDIFEYEVL